MSEDQKKHPEKHEAKESHPQPKLTSDKPHHLKISQMSLAEIEQAIEKTEKQMGGLHSHFGKALVARKEFLAGEAPLYYKKAA